MMKSSVILAAALISAPIGAMSQNFDNVATADLLPGWRMDDGRHMAGLRINLAPGWKTYWRSPGDAGIPPQFSWDGSSNLTAAYVHFPSPGVFEDNGMQSVGYTEDVILPVEVTVGDRGQDAHLRAVVQIGVCEEICIPMSFNVNAVLPAQGGSTGAAQIKSSLALRPLTASEAGLGQAQCKADPIADGMRVTVSVDVPPSGATETVVFEFADPTVWVSSAQTKRDGSTLISQADLVPSHAAPFAISRQDLRFTILTGGRGIDIKGCVAG